MEDTKGFLIYLIYLTICTAISLTLFHRVDAELHFTTKQMISMALAYGFIMPFCQFISELFKSLF